MNIKFGFFPYEAMNYKAAQRWLDRRAEQGWALKHVYLGCIARLQRQERPSHFVDLDIRSPADGTDPDYLQICSDAGWELLQNLRGMLLFRAAPGKSPAPIQTDGEIEWARFWEKYRPRLWHILLYLIPISALILVFSMPSSRNLTAMLALNSGLIYGLYLVLGLVYIVFGGLHSRWYLIRCRRSGQVENPGRIAAFLDGISRLNTPILCLILLFTILEPFGMGKTVDLKWYSPDEIYTATEEVCGEHPVVRAADLGFGYNSYSRHLEGFGSPLMQFLEYHELADKLEPDMPYILTTERYDCLSESLAKWTVAHRREETRKGAFLWDELDWEPAPSLGFDESYTCFDGAYLLFRQGKVVALVQCTGLDLTTEQNVQTIRERVLG